MSELKLDIKSMKFMILKIALFAIVLLSIPIISQGYSKLELEIEQSINAAYEEYKNNVDLNQEANEIIKDSVNAALDEYSDELLLERIQDNIQNAIYRYINDVDTELRTSIKNNTYNYANATIRGQIKNEILTQARIQISVHNSNLKENANGENYSSDYISSRQADLIISNLSAKLDAWTSNLGESISGGILNGADEFCYTSSFVTDAVKKELANVTNARDILNSIKEKVNIQVNNQLQGIITQSIEQYINSNNGEAIYEGIKAGLYEYIDKNGGLDEVIANGLNEDLANYITAEISNLIRGNIQYSINPYVISLAYDVLKQVSDETAEQYVQNKAWSCIVNGFNSAVSQIFSKTAGERIRANLANSVDNFMAGSLTTNVNNFLSSYLYAKELNDVMSDARENVKRNLDANHIFNSAKNNIASYIQSEPGLRIRDEAILELKEVFEYEIVGSALVKTNLNINLWINNGLNKEIIKTISTKIKGFIAGIKDPEEFGKENDIRLGVILKQLKYATSPSYGRAISLEEFLSSPTLISAQRGGILPAIKNENAPLEDATVEYGLSSRMETVVDDLDGSNLILQDPVLTIANAINPRAWVSPYGVQGLPAAISRTIARYDTVGIKDLTPAEAYILAHGKNTGEYPSAVQYAYWQTLQDVRGLQFEQDEGLVDTETMAKLISLLKIVSNIGMISGMVINVIDTASSILDTISSVSSLGELTDVIAAGVMEKFTSLMDMSSIANAQYPHYFIGAIGKKIFDAAGFLSYLTTPAQILGESAAIVAQVMDLIEEATDLIQKFIPWSGEVIEGYNSADPIESIELYQEGKYLEEAVKAWDKFEEENGAILVDKTDYSKTKVSYSKKTDDILVGPFSVDYVRKFYQPIDASKSEMVDTETGIISYTGIVEAKLYADDEKKIEVEDWEFVYPDRRKDVPAADKHYEYPYPNETFYLKFPSDGNYSINTLSKMQFQLEKMDADGQTYQLKGDYNQLVWFAGHVPLVCILPPTSCWHGVIGGHPLPGPSGAYCPPICCMLHYPLIAWSGHLIGHFHFIFRVNWGSDDAMDLEEMISSRIYIEYGKIDIEMGEVQTYYSNGVNNTEQMQPSESQGNISVETSDVPVLPFMKNYPEYPGYPNYPQYEGNPNYPDNPYTFNNENYKDYPSYPYYMGDPTYPYYPENKLIPLTFKIEGNVWLDNPGGTEAEADGLYDSSKERGIPNIEVVLYKKDQEDYIAKTLTDENGHYIFEYVRVGYDYYVDFVYDGVTYRTTKYLENGNTEHTEEDNSELNKAYQEHPENYLNKSQAVENAQERDNFNDKFYEISENMATSKTGEEIPLEYKTWYTDKGAVSTLITTDKRQITKEEFQMHARTGETNLYYPLDNQYQVDYNDLDLFHDGTDYYVKTYECLEHINLGLIKREQGDFSIKTDAYQVITTIKSDVQKYKYDEKPTQEGTYDILFRGGDYYTKNPYNQEINPDDYSYRIDKTYGDYTETAAQGVSLKDELNVYIEYKILIRNDSTLQKGRIAVLENSFDENLEYKTKYDFTNLASWVEVPMNNDNEPERKEIIWEYREGTENGYSTLYTEGIKDKEIAPGETVELHIILQVKKDDNRGIEMDLIDGSFKENITEVHTYSFSEGIFDMNSNPGSAKLGYSRTYSNAADPAPLLKLIFTKNYTLGNIITGYAWEDLINANIANNNEYISNGLRDKNEKHINGIKVELVEVLTDEETGKEIEVLRKTASGTMFYRTGEDIKINGKTQKINDGQYMFTKLETGVYRVKFTYGDEYQLTKDITYNGQDYKTLSLDTTRQQYNNPDMEVMMLIDTSKGMHKNERENSIKEGTQALINELYTNIQKIKVGGIYFSEPAGTTEKIVGLTEKPDKENLLAMFKQQSNNMGGTLEKAINQAIAQFSKTANSKIIVICTDGYLENTARDKEALKRAEEAGIKIISVVYSTDEWDKTTFGTEAEPTTGILYNVRDNNIKPYLRDVVLEDILLELESILPNLADGKDVEYEHKVNNVSEIGDVYSRKRNIDYSSVITNENGEILNIPDTSDIKKLAENTQVTAITAKRNILFSHDNRRTSEVNLGLVERPKVEIQTKQEVSRIQIKLSDGNTIIDTAKDLTQNVQTIKNQQYLIFMDEEIMQGATITVEYKITITNNGHVDTLADYFTYDMYNPTEVAKYTRTVPVVIGTINNYYTNLTFREEDNNNMYIEVNDVELRGLQFNKSVLQNWERLIQKGKVNIPEITRIETRMGDDNKPIVASARLSWELNDSIKLKEEVSQKINKDQIKVNESKSLKNVELFPNISKEALTQIETSSINIYATYSKAISPRDSQDSLTYKHSTEIVERLSEVGRRDYKAIPGDYVPHSKIEQYDSSMAEKIVILPPFGNNNIIYYGLAIIVTVILIGGIIFIKRKVL